VAGGFQLTSSPWKSLNLGDKKARSLILNAQMQRIGLHRLVVRIAYRLTRQSNANPISRSLNSLCFRSAAAAPAGHRFNP
jgi:hypothetical protein